MPFHSALFEGIGGFLTSSLTGVATEILPSAVSLGKSLLTRELNRVVARTTKTKVKAQIRQTSDLVGQSPAVPGQTAVGSGGRTFQPVGLVTNVIPPGISGLSIRPVGAGPVNAADRLASRVLRGLNRFPTVARFLGPAGTALTAVSSMRRVSPMGDVFPGGVDPMFAGRNGFASQARAFVGPRQAGSGPMPGTAVAPSIPGRQMAPVVWERNIFGGVQHYVLDQSGCLEKIEEARVLDGLPKFRLDLANGRFMKIKSRRMNPLNFKALGRARRRTGAALRVCRTMFTEARREKTGRVRPKRRAKKR